MKPKQRIGQNMALRFNTEPVRRQLSIGLSFADLCSATSSQELPKEAKKVDIVEILDSDDEEGTSTAWVWRAGRKVCIILNVCTSFKCNIVWCDI